MTFLKRTVKIIGLVILITLASLGIGITGAAPISLNRRGRDNNEQTRIELVEDEKETADESEIKQIH